MTYACVSWVALRTPVRYGPKPGRRKTSTAERANATCAGLVPKIQADHYMWVVLFGAPWNRSAPTWPTRAMPYSTTFGGAIPAKAGNRCYAAIVKTQQLPALSPHSPPVGYEQLNHSRARALGAGR
jgi:hypothetical protein